MKFCLIILLGNFLVLPFSFSQSINSKRILVSKSTSNKSRPKKISKAPKYQTLYSITYKDKMKFHEFRFLKDMNNTNNTFLKLKTAQKVISKKISHKEALAIERNFKKIWSDSKYRTPSRAKNCSPYVKLRTLLGNQTVCAENQNIAFESRNFLKFLNSRF